MFELADFCKWIPNRVIAGAYVCGKWPKEITKHQDFISNIGMASYKNKIKLLTNEDVQNQFWLLMKSWLMGRGSILVSEKKFYKILNNPKNYEMDLKILSKLRLIDYDKKLHGQHLKNIWNWAKAINKNKAKIVAVSKFLHHILPNLIVPIDRKYTEVFLGECAEFERKHLKFDKFSDFEKALFIFQQIAKGTKKKLSVNANGQYANTSDTKTIDNWIIMWTDLQLKD